MVVGGVSEQVTFCDIFPAGFEQAAALLGTDYDGWLIHDGWAVYIKFSRPAIRAATTSDSSVPGHGAGRPSRRRSLPAPGEGPARGRLGLTAIAIRTRRSRCTDYGPPRGGWKRSWIVC